VTAAPAFSRDLIEATEPPEYRGVARDGVRLLVTNRETRSHTHAHFYDLPRFLRPGDLLVVNDSATIPAAILAQRRNGDAIRLHVSTKIDERLWMVEPRGPVATGETLILPGDTTATAISPVDPEQPRLWYFAFALKAPMYVYLTAFGTPIRYRYLRRSFPLRDYQTLFAREIGSSEMPSAARPFTKSVLAGLRGRGVAIVPITLHCGVASFESPERPATERFTVSSATANSINEARRQGSRVIAIGTTVVRALESAATDAGVVAASGWTDLIIDQTYRPKAVDTLLSGFHDTNATHISLLHAFADAELLQDAYAIAAESGYRYHEFGDVHLIL
jgi:S-adenosylmethionine:tRNA ribosyltransferase-isomerase